MTTLAATTILNRKKGYLKGQITRINSFLQGESVTAKEYELKLTSLLNLKKTEQLRNKYCSSIKQNELEPVENSLIKIEEQLEELEVRLLNITNPILTEKIVKTEIQMILKLNCHPLL